MTTEQDNNSGQNYQAPPQPEPAQYPQSDWQTAHKQANEEIQREEAEKAMLRDKSIGGDAPVPRPTDDYIEKCAPYRTLEQREQHTSARAKNHLSARSRSRDNDRDRD